jgi:hypothetical protein
MKRISAGLNSALAKKLAQNICQGGAAPRVDSQF